MNDRDYGRREYRTRVRSRTGTGRIVACLESGTDIRDELRNLVSRGQDLGGGRCRSWRGYTLLLGTVVWGMRKYKCPGKR